MSIFISYSHADQRIFNEFLIHLQPVENNLEIIPWSDRKIEAGDLWQSEIDKAIRRSRLAILLVSPDFLASRFIADNELPPILDKSDKGELKVFWIPIRPSLYSLTSIVNYQAAYSPDKPLSGLSKSRREKAFVEIVQKLINTIKKESSQILQDDRATKYGSIISLLQSPLLDIRDSDYIADIYFNEAFLNLRALDIFNKYLYNIHISNTLQDIINVNKSIRQPLLLKEDSLNLSHGEWLGITENAEADKHLLSDTPIEIGVTFGQAGTIAIFYYLRYIKGYNIHLNLKNQHTVELSDRVLGLRGSSAPDLASLCLVPAARILSSSEYYQPLMLQPPITYDIVTNSSTKNIKNIEGDILLVRGKSTSEYLIKNALSLNAIDKRRISLIDSNISEMSSMLNNKEPGKNAVLWFPFTQLNSDFSHCSKFNTTSDLCLQQKVIIFAHRSFLANKQKTRALVISIRDAWQTLAVNPSILKNVIYLMTSNEEFLSLLLRYSGFSNFLYGNGKNSNNS